MVVARNLPPFTGPFVVVGANDQCRAGASQAPTVAPTLFLNGKGYVYAIFALLWMFTCLQPMLHSHALLRDVGLAALGPWTMFCGNAWLLLTLTLGTTRCHPGHPASYAQAQHAILWLCGDILCLTGGALLLQGVAPVESLSKGLPWIAGLGCPLSFAHAGLCIATVHMVAQDVELAQYGVHKDPGHLPLFSPVRGMPRA